jgi:hypothetical protein
VCRKCYPPLNQAVSAVLLCPIDPLLCGGGMSCLVGARKI